MTWIHHWIVNDIYTPIWPNLAASAVTGITVVKRFKKHLRDHRKWQAKHFQSIHARLMSGSQAATSAEANGPSSQGSANGQ